MSRIDDADGLRPSVTGRLSRVGDRLSTLSGGCKPSGEDKGSCGGDSEPPFAVKLLMLAAWRSVVLLSIN